MSPQREGAGSTSSEEAHCRREALSRADGIAAARDTRWQARDLCFRRLPTMPPTSPASRTEESYLLRERSTLVVSVRTLTGLLTSRFYVTLPRHASMQRLRTILGDLTGLRDAAMAIFDNVVLGSGTDDGFPA